MADHDLEEADVRVLRARVHKLADMVQAHEGTIREHGVMLTTNARSIEILGASAATREQLDHAIGGMSNKLERFHSENSIHLAAQTKDLEAIKSGVTWVVRLVIGAVILAILGYFLQRTRDDDRSRSAVYLPGDVFAHPLEVSGPASLGDALSDWAPGDEVPPPLAARGWTGAWILAVRDPLSPRGPRQSPDENGRDAGPRAAPIPAGIDAGVRAIAEAESRR